MRSSLHWRDEMDTGEEALGTLAGLQASTQNYKHFLSCQRIFFFFFFFFFLYIGFKLLEMTQLTRKLPIAPRLILRGSPGPTA